MTASVPVRLFGVPHLPSASVQVGLSIVTSIATLNSSDSALLSHLAAGEVWSPIHLLQKSLLTARQWVLNAEVADAAVTPLGGNPGSLANVNLTGDLSLSETAGGSRFVLTLTSIGALEANTLTSVTLDNSSGWASPLGLVEEGTSKTFNASGGIVTMAGEWQPRTVFVFPRSEQDTGDRRTKPVRFSHPLGDGSLSLYEIGGAYVRRDYTLIQLEPSFAGPAFPVATFASFGATRRRLNVKSLTVNPLDGSTDAFNRLDLLAAHDWIQVGNVDWCTRVKQVNATSIDLWEPIPSSLSFNAGDEIFVISEAAAMELEAARTGHLLVYGQDDSSDVPMFGACGDYALFGEGKTDEGIERPIATEPLFNWRYPLIKRRKASLTLP